MIVTDIASACGRGTRRINELNWKLTEAAKKQDKMHAEMDGKCMEL